MLELQESGGVLEFRNSRFWGPGRLGMQECGGPGVREFRILGMRRSGELQENQEVPQTSMTSKGGWPVVPDPAGSGMHTSLRDICLSIVRVELILITS